MLDFLFGFCDNGDMKEEKMLKDLAREIKKAGGRAFLVGGIVRDRLLARESHDIDIEVFNLEEENLAKILQSFGDFVKVGKTFGVYRLNDKDIDVALPRKEIKKGLGHRDFTIISDPYMTYKKACQRRDFTVNALLEDVLSGEILDFYGGLADLRSGILRHVDDEKFVEDPLRVLRAARFCAQLDFKIAPSTLKLCQDMDISMLSKERIYEESRRALDSLNPYAYFDNLKEMGHLEFYKGLAVDDRLKAYLDAALSKKDEAFNYLNLLIALLAKCSADPKVFLDNLLISKKQITDVLNLVWAYDFYANKSSDDKASIFAAFDQSKNPHDLIILSTIINPSRGSILSYYYPAYQDFLQKPFIKGEDLEKMGIKDKRSYGELLKKGRYLMIDKNRDEVLKELKILWEKVKKCY